MARAIRCADLHERLALGRSDRVLWVSSLAFDLSIFDIFGVLGGRGRRRRPGSRRPLDPKRWAEAVHAHGVTLWNSVPALADLMLTGAGDAAAVLLGHPAHGRC